MTTNPDRVDSLKDEGWGIWAHALLALTMWREARGEGEAGMQAVGCVVRNRAPSLPVDPRDLIAVMVKKWQFSSLTAPGDAMLVSWPDPHDPQFETALTLASGILDGSLADNTHQATHYFNPHVVLPTWAAALTKVASIGRHEFYR